MTEGTNNSFFQRYAAFQFGQFVAGSYDYIEALQ
jgi:hypothetical protein